MSRFLLIIIYFLSISTYAQILPSYQATHVKKHASSSGTVTFANCSSSGINGPSQSDCNTAYSGTTLDGDVTVTSGIQLWTVPSNGTYTIEVWGAKGGYDGSCSSSFGGIGGTACRGLNGARMKGSFSLNQGDILRIAVGQMGEDYQSGSSGGGGGGGGTFVAKGSNHSSATALIISGGGGGGHYGAETTPKQGQTSESALSNVTTGNSYNSGAGGSWSSDGANGNYGTLGGKGWANLLIGGIHATSGGTHWSKGDGGFGGGGGGCWPGGNGGGYNGAPSINSYGNDTPGGGGGGSYNSGSNQDNSIGAGDSHGKVTITW
jgi:hypothetical protein